MSRTGKAYAEAGVDISLGNRVKSTLPQLLAKARRPEVLGEAGGFGGLFAFNKSRYRRPVLVSSVDGVGTKLKLAFMMGRHDTIGQDLVNHCVNDIAVIGAEPLFFLDYLGTSNLKPKVFRDIISGFAIACAENRCALIGGETAQMPGFYAPGEYDLSGTIVGVVERGRMLDGRKAKPGDAVIGVASNGLHTNGYSLARRVLFDRCKLKPGDRLDDLDLSIGDELLRIHRSYGPLIAKLLKKFNASSRSPVICGLAHITGGGFIDNIPRALPKNCDAIIQNGSWETPAIFSVIQRKGRVSAREMLQVFNMGIGLTLIVKPEHADPIRRSIRRQGHQSWIIGRVETGSGKVRTV